MAGVGGKPVRLRPLSMPRLYAAGMLDSTDTSSGACQSRHDLEFIIKPTGHKIKIRIWSQIQVLVLNHDSAAGWLAT